ncbi:MAG: CZB domain-containing protein [Sulfuritalea sp.]|nr:CZB domain-containing protein [Sulfuritalea sp.]
MQEFDFDSAIDMHRSWKMKFHLAIDTIRSEDFDTQPIGDEAGCSLGQWLAANAGELARFGSARELLAIHQEFHRQSASIADAIKKGGILHLTDPTIVEFGKLSARIEALLLQLRSQIQQAG